MTKPYTVLDELLDDPMVQLVMKRDRVRPENLRSMIERAQARSESGVPPAPLPLAGCERPPECACA